MRAMRGYTMIELLVAIALGLMVTAAATQLFVTGSVTASMQRGMNDVQSSGRYALEAMIKDVRLAGLAPDGAKSPRGLPMVTSQIPGLASTSTFVNQNNTQQGGIGGANSSDQLVVQYYAPYDMTDCEGTTVVRGALVVNRYFLRVDADSGLRSLACDGGTTDALTGYGTNGVVLVSGVESFQVQYGIDDGFNKQANVARYINAKTYQDLGTNPPIIAVRIGLLVRTQEMAPGAQKIAPANDIWVLDNQIVKSTAGLADGSLRRLFITTIEVRNLDLDEV